MTAVSVNEIRQVVRVTDARPVVRVTSGPIVEQVSGDGTDIRWQTLDFSNPNYANDNEGVLSAGPTASGDYFEVTVGGQSDSRARNGYVMLFDPQLPDGAAVDLHDDQYDVDFVVDFSGTLPEESDLFVAVGLNRGVVSDDLLHSYAGAFFGSGGGAYLGAWRSSIASINNQYADFTASDALRARFSLVGGSDGTLTVSSATIDFVDGDRNTAGSRVYGYDTEVGDGSSDASTARIAVSIGCDETDATIRARVRYRLVPRAGF